MKKISLSKQTLRVLTAQETSQVAGAAVTMPATRCVSQEHPCPETEICPTWNCQTNNCSATCNCTVGCATNGCATQGGCLPPTTNRPGARCACPDK